MNRAAIALVLAATAGTASASSHCHEVSPVVGRQHCSRFGGGWADSWLFGFLDHEVAMVVARVDVPAFDTTGTVMSPTGAANYHAQLAPGASHSMLVVGPRFVFGYRSAHFLAGLELSAMWGVRPPTTTTQVDGFAAIGSSTADVIDVGGIVGAHTRAGQLELSAVVAFGDRSLWMPQSLPAGYTTCDGGGTGKSCALTLSDDRLRVEPRLGVDYWFSRYGTLGVAVGVSAIGGGQSFAVNLALHGAPYDGE